MIFTRTEEETSYIAGKQLGFLFSYSIFFSLTYFMLSRTALALPPYALFISGMIFLYLLYKLIRWVTR